MMTIQFNLDEDDFVRLWRYSIVHEQRRNWKSLALRMAAYLFVLGLLSVVTKLYIDPMYFLYPAVIIPVMALIGLFTRRAPGYLKRAVQNQFRGTRGLLGERTVRISAEGVEQSSEYIQSKSGWPSIADIVNSHNFILLLHVPNGTISGYFIPKRAFPTPDAADRFFQAAYSYWRGETPPTPGDNSAEPTVWPPPPQAV